MLASLGVKPAPLEFPVSDRFFLRAGNRAPKATHSFLGKWQVSEDTGTSYKASGDREGSRREKLSLLCVLRTDRKHFKSVSHD